MRNALTVPYQLNSSGYATASASVENDEKKLDMVILTWTMFNNSYSGTIRMDCLTCRVMTKIQYGHQLTQ